MPPTKDTRKSCADLTLDDLEVFPIWEFALDEEGVEGRDESWVRPVLAAQVPIEYSQIVAASFQLHSGELIPGYVIASPKLGVGDRVKNSGGALFTAGGQCSILNYVHRPLNFHARRSIEVLQKTLGKSHAEIFPMQFTLAVPIQGESVLHVGFIEPPPPTA